jgi:hypothetical protein
MKRLGIRFSRRLFIERFRRDRLDQFVRIAMELSKLAIQTLNEFVHRLIESLHCRRILSMS